MIKNIVINITFLNKNKEHLDFQKLQQKPQIQSIAIKNKNLIRNLLSFWKYKFKNLQTLSIDLKYLSLEKICLQLKLLN